MITSITWVPKGAARAVPLRYELSAEERQRVRELAAREVSNKTTKSAEEREHIASGKTFGEEALDEFNLDDYDDDEEDEALKLVNVEVDNTGREEMFEVIDQGEMAVAVGVDSDQEDDDADDNEIRPGDSLFVVAHTDDEDSHIEVQLYNEEDGTLYIHHDIYLPEFPLCVAWLDCPPYLNPDGAQLSVGNYIAVGSFAPSIEIWNLDVLDPLEPSATLGGLDTSKGSKKKSSKGKGPKFSSGSHTDSVLGLSWNKTFRQAIASASADMTIKIWDVTTQSCSHTFSEHRDKVQNVLWHPAEGWMLASASFDKTIAVFDCRSGGKMLGAAISADPESLAWNPNEPNQLYCSLEDGMVVCIDIRQASTGKGNVNHLFSFRAHEETTSSVSFSPIVPGLMATSSIDKTVKVWDVLSASKGSGLPHTVAYKTMNVGKLFAMQFSSDTPYLLACGGDKGMVAVWESDELDVIRNYFNGREPIGSSAAVAAAAVELGSSVDRLSLKMESVDGSEAMVLDEELEHVSTAAESKKKKNKNKKKNTK